MGIIDGGTTGVGVNKDFVRKVKNYLNGVIAIGVTYLIGAVCVLGSTMENGREINSLKSNLEKYVIRKNNLEEFIPHMHSFPQNYYAEESSRLREKIDSLDKVISEKEKDLKIERRKSLMSWYYFLE